MLSLTPLPRFVVVLSVTVAAVSFTHYASAQPTGQARPNVLFIMADDLRPELTSYGSVAITPNLTRLAARSVQFRNAYCQQAVCNPSRSSMLTGLRPDTLRLWSNGTHFRDASPAGHEATTLPKWFMQHGYTSRCVGKIFHNWHTAAKGDRGSWSADEFLHYANHGDDAAQASGELPPNLSTANIREYGNGPACECRDVPDEAYYDGRVAAEAVRVLGEVKAAPFFLAVGFWKPHAPFNAPKKYWDLYERAKIPELNAARPSGAPDIAFHQSSELLGQGKGRVTLTSAQAQEWRHGYFANISYMDAQLGKVLDALDASGAAERTIIVFCGDHGYHIGEHELWGKTSNFEYDAHTPLLIHAPGNGHAGEQTAALVELVDLFPTLTDLAALPRPPGLEGSSLVPVLSDPTSHVDSAAFTQHPRPAYFDREPKGQPSHMGYSVRTARVRYTEWREWPTGKVTARELYDSLTDRAELKNVIDQPALHDAQAEAERLLHAQSP
jgi:iduronate 2-sulfatase